MHIYPAFEVEEKKKDGEKIQILLQSNVIPVLIIGSQELLQWKTLGRHT
jgi:1-acyl-sn-glycerol-3-phosphate acyltransferase